MKLLITLLILMAPMAQGQDAVQDIVSRQMEALKQAQPTAISDDKLKDIHTEIFGKILATNFGFDLYLYYLGKTWDRLAERHKILLLSDGTRELFSIPKQFCHKEKCHDLVAAYLPFIDVLLISDQAPADELAKWIYHELVHAFQYTYRLPLDVANIMAAVNDGNSEMKLNPSDTVDFLKYFYESQANYYVLRAMQDKDWINYGKSGLLLLPGSFAKATLAAATFGQSLRLFNGFITEWLPEVDNKNWRQGYLHIRRGEQLDFHELIVLRNKWWQLNPSFNFDLRFHINFSLAIEEAYFGKTPFLLKDHGGDQRIFKKMHDDYYQKIILNATIEESGCHNLLKKVTENAPLVGWLTVDVRELQNCPVYRNFLGYRSDFQDLYLQNNNKFYDKGGEGGPGPGLRISPNFYQPQLVIKPPRK